VHAFYELMIIVR